MRTILLGLLLLAGYITIAQRECATYTYAQQLKKDNSVTAKNINDAENFLQNTILSKVTSIGASPTGSNIIYIPVVVHVLYNNESQNISDAQVQSQVDALNRDFRRAGKDTVNTPARFKPFATDAQIEFVLATSDPKGRSTNGIVRKRTNVSYWTTDDKIKFSANGGDDAWDSKSYLNIWVGNTRTLLGYSSPLGGPAEKDGIVINVTAFGTINVNAPYHLGRTAVHEVGHWLGLKHIWGDDYCGDDLIADTPKQAGFTAGCPSGFRTTCGNDPLGDMYMNFMDFTSDECMNLFTAGQKERMRAVLTAGGPRSTILSSKGLHEPWNNEITLPEEVSNANTFKPYPNPSLNEININFDNTTWIGKELSIVNMNGVLIQKITINNIKQKINTTALKSGVYFIQVNANDAKMREKFVKL